MRKSIIAGAAITASLAFAGTAQAADVNVQSLTGEWQATNSTVTKVADGIHFGTYANGHSVNVFGSVKWTGPEGTKLKDVTDLGYTFNFKADGDAQGAAPYMRAFLDADGDGVADNVVSYEPSEGRTQTPAQGVDLTRQMVGGSIRVNDDPGSGPQTTWTQAVTDHGNEEIVFVAVTQGASSGTDVSAMLKNITFNGDKFRFDIPPAAGQNGQNGTHGTNGTDGSNGSNGTNGTNGVTTIIHQYEGRVTGNTMRVLRTAKTFRGMKLSKVRATMRGVSLPVHGRKIMVDLSGKTVGAYNVSIVAKYRKGGKTRTVRSIRTLSITHS